MIVVNVLMISCQVLMLWISQIDGAHTTTRTTQKAKNHALLTNRDAAVANLSNHPTCALTSSGISACFWSAAFVVGFDVVVVDFVGMACSSREIASRPDVRAAARRRGRPP